MGLDSKELSIDLNCCISSPGSFSDLLTEVSLIDDIPMKLSTLNDYVYFFEQERRKVDAFKRELPLSIILLNDAIAKLKEEVLQLKRRAVDGVAKEKFMPPGGNYDEGDGAKVCDKKNWMSSAQLWSTPVQYENDFGAARVQDSVLLRPRCKERDDGITRRSPYEALNFNNKRKGLVPIDERTSGAIKAEVVEDLAVDGLSLSMPVADMGSDVDQSLKGKIVASHDCISEGSSSKQSKKQRRCWSQDLHQSFVNALRQLGGSQAATPKQIREIMKVDGLTNDEVKSHLQKYRLHIRKLQPSPSGAGALPNMENWLKGEERKHKAAQPSGSPEGPLHLGSAVKGFSVTNGESVEEEEDTKSESQGGKDRFHKPSQA